MNYGSPPPLVVYNATVTPTTPFCIRSIYNLLSYFNNTQDADLASLEPTLAHWNPLQEQEIKQILKMLEVKEQGSINKRLAEGLFPILTPRSCSDFQNVVLNSDGSASNQVINLSDGLDSRIYLLFQDVPLDGLTHIKYRFGTKGPDVQIKVFQNQIDGPLLQQIDLPFTSSTARNIWEFHYQEHQFEAESPGGRHDLIFELINTTQKAPQGLVNLKHIELVYDGQSLSATHLDQKLSLLELLNQADRTPIMKAKQTGFFALHQGI